ncbi:unnamed protein product [Vitrella brassicaformis CCMP3155]|uniref:Small ribosomal subunit protein mS29 n=2 Tax=Vitrella brassicaformis TaxID=1169539 RepID=A0A0G4EFS6_VITBC|nr:unnamed protein product [Vitrella brassicaformis CCMP3155]|eukprot:CEL94235.1 unnamed protein product [Vitrella brassicaformis CCMP3155]
MPALPSLPSQHAAPPIPRHRSLPRQQRQLLATAAGAAPAVRRSGDARLSRRYDLPVETDSTLVSERERRHMARLAMITEEEQMDIYPAVTVGFAPTPTEVEPVKRPFLYIPPENLAAGEIGVDDIGRFRLFVRDSLTELIPEGLCGELPKDITMFPSRTTPVGIMLRKPAFEMISQLQQVQQHRGADGGWTIPKGGFLIDGHRGTGKSAVLNFLVAWARESGWLVIFEPSPRRYAHEIGEIKRSNTGVYIQSEFTQQFLERVSVRNREMLERMPVHGACYGDSAIDGSHHLYTQRVYDPLIGKVVQQRIDDKLSGRVSEEESEEEGEEESEESSEEESGESEGESETATSGGGGALSKDDAIGIQRERLRLWHAYRKEVKIPSLRDRLPSPENLYEIVDFGLQNEAFATQCAYELFEQLKKQTTFPLMIAVDQWNECFPVSEYLSIKYENTKYNGYIPAFHLTMPRLFHKWDGWQLKRGIKVAATCWKYANRRDYRPELLKVKREEVRTVRNFSAFEFANFVAYYRRKRVIQHFPREKLDYFYMLTGGNGFQSRRLLAMLY